MGQANQTILIIGGTRGIGLSGVKELTKAGYSVIVAGRSEAHLEEALRQLPEGTKGFTLDAFAEDAGEKIQAYLKKTETSLSGLVLDAAGFAKLETQKSVVKPTADELDDILRKNVVSNYRMVRALLPELKKNRAQVVLIGSTAGVRRDKGGIYGISKWALRSYAYQLRDELKEEGIRVHYINPGGTFTETRIKEGPEDQHLLETSDIGKAIAFVFSLSPQAVVEQIDLRPISGDTY